MCKKLIGQCLFAVSFLPQFYRLDLCFLASFRSDFYCCCCFASFCWKATRNRTLLPIWPFTVSFSGSASLPQGIFPCTRSSQCSNFSLTPRPAFRTVLFTLHSFVSKFTRHIAPVSLRWFLGTVPKASPCSPDKTGKNC